MGTFIERLAPIAVKHGKAANVLPSLLLAQGILESASGTSELAVQANNLFGIKRGSGWTGEVYAKDSKEYSDMLDREGNVIGWFSMVSEFRKYPSYAECVKDLLHKYTHGLTWEKHNRYSAVVGETDYKRAAQAVFAAGYATDPTYPQKLIRVIEQNNLSKFDEKEVENLSKASDFLVALDDGHGEHTAGKRTPYIASLGRSIRENEFNQPTVNFLEAELKRCGFRTIQLAPTNADTPLATRTATANRAKANLLISVHFNAMGNTFGYSTAKGFSVHIQPADKANPKSGSLKFAKLAIEELAKGTAQVNRGVVGQNLHMTRVSNMPAALVECGFMDDPDEALLMINKSFQQEVARELATAVCRYFGVPYVVSENAANTAAQKFYRVRKYWDDAKSQVGAFVSFAIAKGAADEAGLNVYDESGKLVHSGKKTEPKKEEKPVGKDEKNATAGKSLVKGQEWVKKIGISDGTYPNRPVTRAEFWETLRRYDEQK